MKRLINIGLLCILFFTAHVRASPILTGDVSFSDITNLYTYTYTLDTSSLTENTTEVAILQNLGFHSTYPLPISHSEPEGWSFNLSSGGLVNSGDKNISGSFWMWVGGKSLGDDSSDQLIFSFTTERGVNTSQANNYFIFNDGGNTGPTEAPGVIEIGHIIGPEFITLYEVPPIVTTVPENETYAMMMAGLGIVGFMARRKSKPTSNTKKV